MEQLRGTYHLETVKGEVLHRSDKSIDNVRRAISIEQSTLVPSFSVSPGLEKLSTSQVALHCALHRDERG